MYKDRAELREAISLQYGMSKDVLAVAKEYQGTISVFDDILDKSFLVTYDKVDYKDKDSEIRMVNLYDIPSFLILENYPIKQLTETLHCREIPSTDFIKYGKKIEGDNIGIDGLSARDRVCIELRVPQSTKDWLNGLIMASLKNNK